MEHKAKDLEIRIDTSKGLYDFPFSQNWQGKVPTTNDPTILPSHKHMAWTRSPAKLARCNGTTVEPPFETD